MSETSGRGLFIVAGGLSILGMKWQYMGPHPVHERESNHKSQSELREELVRHLNSLGDIKSVTDLVASRGGVQVVTAGFSPILLEIRLPISLQKEGLLWQSIIPAQKVETFHVVYDGLLVIYAAEIDLSLPFTEIMFLDLRENLAELIGSHFRPESVAPNIGGRLLLGEIKFQSLAQAKGAVFLPITSKIEPADALRRVYGMLHMGLWEFYQNCRMVRKVQETEGRVRRGELDLLANLEYYLSSKWHNFRLRRRLQYTLESGVNGIFQLISKYFDYYNVVKVGRNIIEEDAARNSLLREFLDNVRWLSYASVEPLNIDQVMRVLDHVKSEAESFRTSSIAVISALIGGVIGAILTMVVELFVKLV